MWGANDFGGTLINESISTSAGSEHGQLLRPKRNKANGTRDQKDTSRKRHSVQYLKKIQQ